jgi:hypothetical protein
MCPLAIVTLSPFWGIPSLQFVHVLADDQLPELADRQSAANAGVVDSLIISINTSNADIVARRNLVFILSSWGSMFCQRPVESNEVGVATTSTARPSSFSVRPSSFVLRRTPARTRRAQR